jgi:hypothetical protein
VKPIAVWSQNARSLGGHTLHLPKLVSLPLALTLAIASPPALALEPADPSGLKIT